MNWVSSTYTVEDEIKPITINMDHIRMVRRNAHGLAVLYREYGEQQIVLDETYEVFVRRIRRNDANL